MNNAITGYQLLGHIKHCPECGANYPARRHSCPNCREIRARAEREAREIEAMRRAHENWIRRAAASPPKRKRSPQRPRAPKPPAIIGGPPLRFRERFPSLCP